MTIHLVSVVTVCVVLVGCASAWTRSELLAAQLVSAVEHVSDEATRSGWRPDQGARATQSARAISELLAHAFPDGDKIRIEIAVVDASLGGLATGPETLRERVRSAQGVLMQFRIELARRKRLVNLIPYR